MPKQINTEYWLGTDHGFPVHVLTLDEQAALDITGWGLSWKIKRSKDDDDDAALVTKTTSNGGITIAGVFNADKALNAQRATVVITDTDTDPLEPGNCYYELKRTDQGSEQVITFGRILLLRAVHRA
jgi:hypothetical protein